jgi:hypothetical protein
MEDMPNLNAGFYESEAAFPARKLISLLRVRLRDLQIWADHSQYSPVLSPEDRKASTRGYLLQVRVSALAAINAIDDVLAAADTGKEEPDANPAIR